MFCLREFNFNPTILLSYFDRIPLIKLSTLKSRRTILNISFIFNVITGDIGFRFFIHNITFNIPQDPSQHFYLLSIQFLDQTALVLIQ